MARFKQHGDFIFNLDEVEYVSLHAELTEGGRHYEVGETFHLKSGDTVRTLANVIGEGRIADYIINLEAGLNDAKVQQFVSGDIATLCDQCGAIHKPGGNTLCDR